MYTFRGFFRSERWVSGITDRVLTREHTTVITNSRRALIGIERCSVLQISLLSSGLGLVKAISNRALYS